MNKFGKLELIVFVGGAVVMILELIGSRIMAPYLGTSLFVWTSIIGIILGALSLGYYLGGKFSVKNPTFSTLSSILFSASLLVLLITYIKDPVLSFSSSLGVKSGSVMATVFLMSLPSIVLGMISPYAVRLNMHDVDHSGGVAGNLYALSTIGSIFGTFLSGFYLIPTFGSTQIIFGLSAVLAIVSLLGGKKIFKIIAIIIIGFSWWIFIQTPSPYVFEKDSAYNHIRVRDLYDNGDSIRVLFMATEAHSVMYKNSENLFSEYHQAYKLDNLFAGKILNALTLGGGAYLAPRDFLDRFPDATMDVVEIDPEVTNTAIKYFNFKPNDRLTVYHEDGRIFINNSTKKYDVIYGDAFSSYYSIPFHLTTVQAVKKMYDLLDDDGILVLNVISSLQGEKSLFLQAEYKTLLQYFPQVYIFPVRPNNPDEHQNIILIATKNENKISKETLLQKANQNQKITLEKMWVEEFETSDSIPVLTDEFAPVDNYIAKFLE